MEDSNSVDIKTIFEEIKELRDKLEVMEKNVSEKLKFPWRKNKNEIYHFTSNNNKVR